MNRRTRRARRRLRRGDAPEPLLLITDDRADLIDVDRAARPGRLPLPLRTRSRPPWPARSRSRRRSCTASRSRRGRSRSSASSSPPGCAGRGSRRCCGRSSAATPSRSSSPAAGGSPPPPTTAPGTAPLPLLLVGRHDRRRGPVVDPPAPPRQGPRRTHPRRLAADHRRRRPARLAGHVRRGRPLGLARPHRPATRPDHHRPDQLGSGAGVRAAHPAGRRPGRARPHRADHAIVRVLTTDPHAQPLPYPATGDAAAPDASPRRSRSACSRTPNPSRSGSRTGTACSAGSPAPGKSGVLNVILAELVACPDVVLWGVDLKGGMELRPWAACLDRLATTPSRGHGAARRRRRRPRGPRPAAGRRRVPAVAAHRRRARADRRHRRVRRTRRRVARPRPGTPTPSPAAAGPSP